MKQQSLASLAHGGMKKRTKREKFLNGVGGGALAVVGGDGRALLP
ncbi:hypothetical protein [Methyloglobulus sp.]